jgi:hypothetical protein
MNTDFGVLTDLVKTVGALASSAFAIGSAWRGRTRWEPAEEDLSRGPQKAGGLVATVIVTLLWVTNADTTRIPFLIHVSVACLIVCLLSLVGYGILIATHVLRLAEGAPNGRLLVALFSSVTLPEKSKNGGLRPLSLT